MTEVAPKFSDKVKTAYAKVIAWVSAHPKTVLVVAAVIVIAVVL